MSGMCECSQATMIVLPVNVPPVKKKSLVDCGESAASSVMSETRLSGMSLAIAYGSIVRVGRT